MGFSNKDEDIEKLIYFWRTIGYFLGMPDEYNLCEGSLEQVRARCRQMFEHNYRPRLLAAVKENDNEVGLNMSHDIIYTAQQYIYFLRYKSLMKYLFEVLSLNGGDDHFRLKTNMEKFTYISMKHVMSHWIHFRLVAFILNNTVRFQVYCLHLRFYTANIVNILGGQEQNNSKW